ncbi:hypothetical protein MLD38_006031 [Melastoma candidum]|uniref:Uncharacterized protein n=1 Tax=Melastoma candidum TaxID=119954 RepID=A0ACB9RMW0_9MYRT|nr:hypothetical protein MLD38_006031 [Melastoma candidum]
MSEVLAFLGDDLCSGWPAMCQNPKRGDPFLSADRGGMNVYYPARKRLRVGAPCASCEEDRYEKKGAEVSIESLPEECLFEILRRLPGGRERVACAGVSRRWLMVLSSIRRGERAAGGLDKVSDGEGGSTSEDEDMVVEDGGFLSRKVEGRKATDTCLAAIAVGTANRGGLGKLSIRGTKSSRVTDLGLRAIAHGCSSLGSLSLWNLPAVTDESLIEIATGCPLLQKLDISRCSKVSDKALISIARNCPNLADITVESCPNIGNEGILAVGKHCLNLKSISLKNCPRVGDQGIINLLSKTCDLLMRVKLQSLSITDVSLAAIGHYGKAVAELVLAGLPNATERGFWAMGNGQGLQKLRSLTIASCQGATDLSLEALSRGCPNVNQLDIRSCGFITDKGLVSLAEAALSLESLQLEECCSITLSGVVVLLGICRDKLKSLAVVNCSGIKDSDVVIPIPMTPTCLRSLLIRNCPGFTDVSLVALGELCPGLERLELIRLPGITDAGFLQWSKSSQAGLTKVNLSGCVQLTDDAISSMAKKHGLTLKDLVLDGCYGISDKSLAAVGESCPELSDLDVSRCGITDYGVSSLACADNLKLQILSVSGCSSVSDRSLPALLKLGRSLIGLNLHTCKAISGRSVELLVQHLFRCDILF